MRSYARGSFIHPLRQPACRLLRRLRLASLVLYLAVIAGSLYVGFSSLVAMARQGHTPPAVEEALTVPAASWQQGPSGV